MSPRQRTDLLTARQLLAERQEEPGTRDDHEPTHHRDVPQWPRAHDQRMLR